MQIIVFLLLGVLLFGMSGTTEVVEEGPVETEETDTTEETTEEGTDETAEEGTDDGTDTDMPLVGNSYDLVIDGEGLNMTFESDGSLTMSEFPEDYTGTYEVTDEYLYVNVTSIVYDETIALELTYDDLEVLTVSGVVNSYELITEDDEISEEDLADFNAQYTGLPYTLEITDMQ